ncbi:hypothetical protein AVDCRST_MAG94-2126 [uncultured Leptolyngbya sp.]|uniref:Short-chain dehydrogenase/reductase SDR n=1 Tax=uncultured Leptolyngbya sp. TaxID=332963 RepID=A0A6J4LN88_9CYAN|nr:hypothetical protein AVDCRST_MAG94-2126 [uncultured Leptolyngbya sp.]
MTKIILITGTSSGLGKATARFFAYKGWSVVATMRQPEKEQQLVQLPNVLVTQLDVQDRMSTEPGGIANTKFEQRSGTEAVQNATIPDYDRFVEHTNAVFESLREVRLST